jgi:hypothetical protein
VQNVTVCDGCPEEVKIEMKAALHVIKDQNTKRVRTKFEVGGMGRSQMAPPVSYSSNARASPSISSSFFLPCTASRSQPTLDSYNEKRRKETDMAVMRLWYHGSLSFNLAKSPFYQPMVDAIANVVPGYKAPSYGAHRGKDLDEELECVKAQLEDIKSSWVSTG